MRSEFADDEDLEQLADQGRIPGQGVFVSVEQMCGETRIDNMDLWGSGKAVQPHGMPRRYPDDDRRILQQADVGFGGGSGYACVPRGGRLV